jgi:ectoine hydroxylase-related dioxygenase (phytanoyl-CoA dioxygenase family)
LQITSLSTDSIAKFKNDGILVLREFFSWEETLKLVECGKQIVADIGNGLVREDRFVLGCLPDGPRQLCRDNKLIELAKELLATDNIALYMNRVLIKDREWNGAVQLHQDMPYFHGGVRKLSVFIPLTSIQADGGNGGLKFVAGSHRFGNLRRGTIKRELFPPMQDVAPELEPGDILLMDFLTWHYSNEALIRNERYLMQIAYQSADDGSYAGASSGGVPEPTLICGNWQTTYFSNLDACVQTDGT